MQDDEPRDGREYEEAMKLRMDSAREDQSIKWNQKKKTFYGAIPPELNRFFHTKNTRAIALS
ncbi:hypothetical protein MTR_4g014400 [Medicago truncatula]|uniref:Uncharacterized protein n=1 Tax=Medicago truncatula TaxID=3880 RepID=G7JKP2_MEDTR|nr:hypothetical protein MTR_4g014400 [Medicago truncatula]